MRASSLFVTSSPLGVCENSESLSAATFGGSCAAVAFAFFVRLSSMLSAVPSAHSALANRAERSAPTHALPHACHQTLYVRTRTQAHVHRHARTHARTRTHVRAPTAHARVRTRVRSCNTCGTSARVPLRVITFRKASSVRLPLHAHRLHQRAWRGKLQVHTRMHALTHTHACIAGALTHTCAHARSHAHSCIHRRAGERTITSTQRAQHRTRARLNAATPHHPHRQSPTTPAALRRSAPSWSRGANCSVYPCAKYD